MGIRMDHIQPITVTILEAVRISGLSRSEIYRRLSSGELSAVKSGARTLIPLERLRSLLDSLPAAVFRAQRSSRV